jgi:hypothetical protein
LNLFHIATKVLKSVQKSEKREMATILCYKKLLSVDLMELDRGKAGATPFPPKETV